MSDARAIEAAAARMKGDAFIPDRIADEVRKLSGSVRRSHPLGYQHVDAVVAAGMAAASSYPRGPEMLLAVEKLQAQMEALRIEADAEAARLAKIADAAALERRFALQAGGHVGQHHLDNAFLAAVRVCRDRLGGLQRHETSEATFAATLDDAENAVRAMMSALSLSRRGSRLRISQEAARAAVAASRDALTEAA